MLVMSILPNRRQNQVSQQISIPNRRAIKSL
jgi:hypothetical protein